MRLVHVVPAISEEASGPSYSVLRLCESLGNRGEAVTLAALDWAPMVSRPACLKTFPLGIGPRRLGRSPTMRGWLVDSARRGDIDLLHSHSLWMMPNVYPAEAARKGSVPLVISPRGTLSRWALQSGSPMKSLFWRLLQKRVVDESVCLHATAESEYEDLRRMGFRQPIAVIPNGIDIPAISPSPVAEPIRTLLFLGRVHPVKGLDVLLPAWGAVQRRFPDWRLRIVGPDSGGHLLAMRRLADELALERIEFSGPLLGDEKWLAYRSAELFVLPSYSENFGVAVAEALASGTPAVVSKGAPWKGPVSYTHLTLPTIYSV